MLLIGGAVKPSLSRLLCTKPESSHSDITNRMSESPKTKSGTGSQTARLLSFHSEVRSNTISPLLTIFLLFFFNLHFPVTVSVSNIHALITPVPLDSLLLIKTLIVFLTLLANSNQAMGEQLLTGQSQLP